MIQRLKDYIASFKKTDAEKQARKIVKQIRDQELAAGIALAALWLCGVTLSVSAFCALVYCVLGFWGHLWYLFDDSLASWLGVAMLGHMPKPVAFVFSIVIWLYLRKKNK